MQSKLKRWFCHTLTGTIFATMLFFVIYAPIRQAEVDDMFVDNPTIQEQHVIDYRNAQAAWEQKRVMRQLHAIMEKSNPKLTDIQRQEYIFYILKHAETFNLDPLLVASVIHRETNYRTHLVSKVGARGPMQVWAKWHKEKLKVYGISEKDLHTKRYGIKIGCFVLQEYLTRTNGDVRKALYKYVGSSKFKGYADDILRMMEYGRSII